MRWVLLSFALAACASAEPPLSVQNQHYVAQADGRKFRYCWCYYGSDPPRCELHSVLAKSRGGNRCATVPGLCVEPRRDPPTGEHRKTEIECNQRNLGR